MKNPPPGLSLAEQARWHADESVRYGRLAIRWAKVSVAFALLSITLLVIRLVLS